MGNVARDASKLKKKNIYIYIINLKVHHYNIFSTRRHKNHKINVPVLDFRSLE
jgi:hypothetical protein